MASVPLGLTGPILQACGFDQPVEGVTARLVKMPPAHGAPPHACSGVLAHTLKSSPPGRSYRGISGQPLIIAFMNSSPSILKMSKLESQSYKLFGKRALLPRALAVQPHDQAVGWVVEHVWGSASPPATRQTPWRTLQGGGFTGSLPLGVMLVSQASC